MPLFKIVLKSNEDDWKKLVRLLLFLKNTIDDKRYIGVFDLESLYTWIYVAYDVHLDMKIHTGGSIFFGRGMLHCWSVNQNINTKSSTEA